MKISYNDSYCFEKVKMNSLFISQWIFTIFAFYKKNKFLNMKFRIILETKEYEKAWNAFRFVVTAKKQGREVKLFRMGKRWSAKDWHTWNSTWMSSWKKSLKWVVRYLPVELAWNRETRKTQIPAHFHYGGLCKSGRLGR